MAVSSCLYHHQQQCSSSVSATNTISCFGGGAKGKGSSSLLHQKSLKSNISYSIRVKPYPVLSVSPRPLFYRTRNFKIATTNNQVDPYHELEPFWVAPVNELVGYSRSLFQFLKEQPGELRHIEFPSLGSTLKTAMLTLVLVALLIVALSSVDAVLSYLLALILRKPL